MKFGEFAPKIPAPANDNESDEEMATEEEKEFQATFNGKLVELMNYFENLNLDAKIASQKIQQEALTDLQKASDKDLMDLVINTNQPQWQAHPSFFAALIVELGNRSERNQKKT